MRANGVGSGSSGGGGKRRWSSPLRVAQCRARCLQRFSGEPSKDAVCMQGPDCFMCWENCELLQSNYAVWGSMCSQKGICFPGCQQACKFHREEDTPDGGASRQMEPVVHTIGYQVLQVVVPERNLGGDIPLPLVRWPQYDGSARNGKGSVVYVLMTRQQGANSWIEVIQTVDLEARLVISPSAVAQLDIRVMVVDTKGLATIYSPEETGQSLGKGPHSQDGLALGVTTNPGPYASSSPPSANGARTRGWPLVIREDITSPLDDAQLALLFPTASAEQVAAAIAQQPYATFSSLDSAVSGSWVLREVSLIHQGVLVIAEVCWESRMGARVYLVTWELDGGGLKGNLFTHSTSVTLSLWPQTLYHIQVEVVSSIVGNSGPPDRSQVMHLDTRNARPVVIASGRRQKAPALLSSGRGVRSYWGAGKEVLVGCAAALTAFLLLFAIMLVFAAVWRRFGRTGCTRSRDKWTSFDHGSTEHRGHVERQASLSLARLISLAVARARGKERTQWVTPGGRGYFPTAIPTVYGQPEAGMQHRQWPVHHPHVDAFLREAERRARTEVQM